MSLQILKNNMYLLLAMALAACSNTVFKSENAMNTARAPSSVSVVPPLDIANLAPELGESWNPGVDTPAADRIFADISRYLSARDVRHSETNRIFHPKHHGCVKADFEVDSSELPEQYRVGVFSRNASYQSWIRFSNGDQEGETAPDINKDIRGMAVKLINIDQTPSGSQDFVMCTAKEFFAKGTADYLKLNKLITDSTIGKIFDIIGDEFSETMREDLAMVGKAKIQTASPLETNYYSATPYKLGDRAAMRFSVEPCENQATHTLPPASEASPNYLADVLQSSLQNSARCFHFYVQVNTDLNHQPVEDPRIAWNEATSPRYKVATIWIPADSNIHSIVRNNFCENLSFDPWHTRSETRPLGNINRMRGLLYKRMSTLRHSENGTTSANKGLPEPKSLENPCVGEAAVLCKSPSHFGH